MGLLQIGGFGVQYWAILSLFSDLAFVMLIRPPMISSLNALPNTAEHYALTDDQLQEVQQDILEIMTRADEIAQLLTAALGDADPRTIRAKEINAAFQRLQWEIQRSDAASAS